MKTPPVPKSRFSFFSAVLLACFFAVFCVSFASAADSDSLCPSDSICAYSGYLSSVRAGTPAELPSVSTSVPAKSLTLREARYLIDSSSASNGETTPKSAYNLADVEALVAKGNWCKGLENDNVQKYALVSGQPMLSWAQVISLVSEKTGVQPEYLCVLLWMESRGNAYDVGGDGECGAFQTMPQFYKNYRDYCSEYSDQFSFVKYTCNVKGRLDPWGDYPFNAYPKADLGFNDPESCFHPLNSATAGAMEFKGKLAAAGGNVRLGFRMYNGAGPQAEAYADKAYNKLQNVYNSLA